MPRQSVFDMKVSKVYPLLVAKAEKKGRTKLIEAKKSVKPSSMLFFKKVECSCFRAMHCQELNHQ